MTASLLHLKIYIRYINEEEEEKCGEEDGNACRTRWLSFHAGVDAAFEEYEGLVISLQKIKPDKASGPVETGLLKNTCFQISQSNVSEW